MQEEVKKKNKPRSSPGKKTLLEKVNLPKIICVHLIGEDHSMHHRMGAGAIIMTIGVIVSQSTAGASLYIIHFFGDMIGYLIHGIGTLPFAEALAAHLKSPSSVERVEGGNEGDEEGLS